jgi:two-component system chemotaxis sensor kinase CheA
LDDAGRSCPDDPQTVSGSRIVTIDLSQFFDVFFEETDELLAEMERLLLAIDLAQPDPEALNAIFRAAHSIKGGASTFGITDLTEITHVLETLLDLIRKGKMPITGDHVNAFLEAKDVLKMQLEGHRSKAPVDATAVEQVKARLEALSSDKPTSLPITSAGKPHEMAPVSVTPPSAMRLYRVQLPLVPERDVTALAAELGLLGSIEIAKTEAGLSFFMLETLEDADAIVAICSFVMAPEALTISELRPLSKENDTSKNRDSDQIDGSTRAPLSRLQELPATPESEQIAGATMLANHDIDSTSATEALQGYGFFTPLPSPPLQSPPTQTSGNSSAIASASSSTSMSTPKLVVPEKRAISDDRRGSSRREPDKAGGAGETSSIRVSVEKVDQLINLVGELVITRAMIEQRSEYLDSIEHERLLNSVSQLSRNARELQEAVMSIRMMPMDYVFSRFPRMVRDLAAKMGKKVEFVTHGAATELDKGLIERIIDPLTHLVRNSVDHGIEMPHQRVAVGKSETGRLSLSASHHGGNVVIEVADDGGGLNRDRILAKAQQNGIKVSQTMPDHEVWQMIFAPGFSTAEEVTAISGRGVGMDVVKRNIVAMGGSVEIRSAKNLGTTMSISLPLTLAILDGMSVKVGDEIYILPLGYVIESLQPAEIDIKEISGRKRVIKVRDEYLPLIELYQLFNIKPRHTNPAHGIIVILESEGRKAALFVDDLVGKQQVVVKNLESNYKKVPGISGATILGDGGVSLIIDVSALLRSAQ